MKIFWVLISRICKYLASACLCMYFLLSYRVCVTSFSIVKQSIWVERFDYNTCPSQKWRIRDTRGKCPFFDTTQYVTKLVQIKNNSTIFFVLMHATRKIALNLNLNLVLIWRFKKTNNATWRCILLIFADSYHILRYFDNIVDNWNILMILAQYFANISTRHAVVSLVHFSSSVYLK